MPINPGTYPPIEPAAKRGQAGEGYCFFLCGYDVYLSNEWALNHDV